METKMLFTLFLLICWLSTVQPEMTPDKKINQHGKEDENEKDIHSVLREMTTMLAKQSVQIIYLQKENEAQAAKLRDVDNLKEAIQVQADKLRELEMQKVDRMKQQLQAHAEELITIKKRSNVTENQVEALRRDGQVKQVAFSASLVASGSGTLGPYNTYVPLVFRYVVTNTGNAYNPNTGFFIAPVKGPTTLSSTSTHLDTLHMDVVLRW